MPASFSCSMHSYVMKGEEVFYAMLNSAYAGVHNTSDVQKYKHLMRCKMRQ